MTIQQGFELALQHHQAGRLNDAESIYRQILAVEPQHVDSLHMLGVIAAQMEHNDAAIELMLQAIALKPDFADAYSNLSHAFMQSGKLDEAADALNRALSLYADVSTISDELGIALYKKGRALYTNRKYEEAVVAYQKAISVSPNLVEAHFQLGLILNEKGMIADSIAAYRRAIAINPAYSDAHNNLANNLRLDGQLQEALASYGRAQALEPNCYEIFVNTGNALYEKGQVNDALAAYGRAQGINPNWQVAGSNVAYIMNFQEASEPSVIFKEHISWNRQYGEPLRSSIKQHSNICDPERRLRVGYVSSDFRVHSVAYFLEGLLEHHNQSQMEIYCYSDVKHPDSVTLRLEKLATHWRSINGLSDLQVTDIIRADGIDILVDLGGHTSDNRLLVFARKPAPVQVSWLGYPNTTGLDTIDYRLTDVFADPPGMTEVFHSERLVRLPHCGWNYRPFAHSPSVSELPAYGTGYITFGCFNAMPKINRNTLKYWALILKAVPNSRLLLKNNALADTSVIDEVSAVFEKQGIGKDRLEFIGRIPDQSNHLATYGKVDIALDTFPYHGTTTTCEALWMGVPVVTLAGNTHVSRVGVSLLSNLGHPEWVAASPDEYVKIATDLAEDIPRLAGLRNSMREVMKASPLMDSPIFARDIETTYREMWQTWCGQAKSKK